MKRTLLLIAGTVMFVIAQAQTPVNRSQSFITKATATWCGPCGAWGWTTHEGILSDNMVGATPNAFVITAYGSNTSDMYNLTADTLSQFGNSWPNWAFNNRQRTLFSPDGSSIYSGQTRTALKKSADSFALLTPTASTGFSATLSGQNLTINTKTKFWKAASGTYQVAMYIFEDSVYNKQKDGLGNDVMMYHHYVLRGSMTPTKTFGEQVGTTNHVANAQYTKNFNYTIPSGWNKSKLKYMAVLWKKVGTTWEVENANSVKSAATGIGEVPSAVDQMIVFPNPATDRLHISGVLNVASDARISLVNAIGQIVYEQNVSYNGGQLKESIDLRNISNGVYNMVIQSEGAQSMQKVVVAK